MIDVPHPAPCRPTVAGLRRFVGVLGAGILTAVLAACGGHADEAYSPTYSGRQPRIAAREYVLAVHPLHNPRRLFEVYQPLVDHLSARVPGLRLRLEASSSYAAFEEKLARREVDFALPNPYQTLKAQGQGYRVFGKMGDDANFRGVILVRRDSMIDAPTDLVGRSMSFPAPTALAATMLPQWFLHERGVDIEDDLDSRYVGTQESSIMNVVLGRTAAGATWPSPWRAFEKERPDLAAQLEVKWQTPALLNNSLMVRDDVPPGLVDAVRGALVTLHDTPEGRALLEPMELSRFEAATDATYRPVQAFVDAFARDVRPLEPAP